MNLRVTRRGVYAAESWQDKRQDKTRQDKTRQDKTGRARARLQMLEKPSKIEKSNKALKTRQKTPKSNKKAENAQPYKNIDAI
jgi:hypothetical protein